MSVFNKIVNVALGEIRNMDGIITPLSNAAIYPGQLFTANRNGVLGRDVQQLVWLRALPIAAGPHE